MKNIVSAAGTLMLALALGSCQKLSGPMCSEENGQACSLTLEFTGVDPGTKVLGQEIGKECTMHDVQIFVFNSATGKLDAARRVASLAAVTQYDFTESIECTQGPREVWALVNAPVNYVDGAASDMVTRLDDLKSRTCTLADNAADRLVMSGNQSVVLNSATQNISISVTRLCASIVLESVTNEMYLPAYQKAGKLRILGAYLMNVPAQQNYEKTLSAKTLPQTSWISTNAKTGDAAQKALTQDVYNEVVELNQKLGKVSTFYAFPNDADPSESATWSQRATMLVVEAEVDGNPCVYPVQLGVLAANTKYQVSLKIHRMGADPERPWEEIKFDSVTPLVTVADWSSGAPVNTEI